MPTASLPLLNSRGLVEQAVDALRGQILAGTYGRDGELPSQDELCESLGVSRSVVREAMQRLQSQRLIEVSQGKRPRVLPAGPEALTEGLHVLMQRSEASLFHLAEVRLTLETEIAARAAEHIADEGLARLNDALNEMRADQSLEEQIDADIRFHRLLAEVGGNPIFAYLLDALAELLRVARRKTIGLGGVEPALKGHRAILKAVERRDPKAARQAMRDHLQHSVHDLEQSERPVRRKGGAR
jgi:DNA-binding FadR family transcriptional regulator